MCFCKSNGVQDKGEKSALIPTREEKEIKLDISITVKPNVTLKIFEEKVNEKFTNERK